MQSQTILPYTIAMQSITVYDMMMIFKCAQKLTSSQLNLAHVAEKNKRKEKRN